MANTFLNAEAISGTVLGVVEREVLLGGLIWRQANADFVGAKGDTVTIRVPARLDAREYEFRNDRTDPIEIDSINEIGVDVKLDHMPYSAVALTDEQLTLDIRTFGDQVLAPQARALVRHMEQLVATTIEDAPIAWTVTESDPFLAAAKARSELNRASVPMAGRALVLGVNAEIAFLSSPLLVRADTSGTDTALRDAEIGRIAGLQTFVSQYIDPDTAYAFHSTAFALANMAPVVPDGATYGQSQVYAGYAARWIRDYDPMFLQDRSVVSAFIGCSSVNDGVQLGPTDEPEHEGENVRAVKITGIQPPTT